MASILVVATPSDLPLTYGYHYLKRFSKYATLHGHQVFFLENVNLQTFHEAIRKHNPQLIIMNGHGGRKGLEIAGHVILGVLDYDPELGKKIYSQNPSICAGRIVILATCNTGKELAFRLIDYGAKAVLAFKEPFIFLSEENPNPAFDKLAEPFFISMLQAAIHLVIGKNFGRSCHLTRKAFKYYQDLMEQKGQDLSAKYLYWNLENLVCLGQMDAII